jgi:hypothetical protein
MIPGLVVGAVGSFAEPTTCGTQIRRLFQLGYAPSETPTSALLTLIEEGTR